VNSFAAALDASALLALIQRESGGEIVEASLKQGALISAVNLSEVASRLNHQGWSRNEIAEATEYPNLLIRAFDARVALETGALRNATARFGLGLGDRACLATASREGLPALTADRAWLDLDLPGIEIRAIR